MANYDPDGAGPHPPEVIVGGSFTHTGTTRTNNIFMWNPATDLYSPMGAGVDGVVYAVLVLPNGDVIAGGQFTAAGGAGAPTNRVARWDGTAWRRLGDGLSGGLSPRVNALCVMPNGDLVAGGTFSMSGASPIANVARWDGQTWSSVGEGLNSSVSGLLVLQNGDLLASGGFTASGTASVRGLARWDGSRWSQFAGTDLPSIGTFLQLPNGDLVVGGNFNQIGGIAANSIARWNGVSWSRLGLTESRPIAALLALPDGSIVAGGSFISTGPMRANHIARWDGVAWSPYAGGTNSSVQALAVLPGGDIAAGGGFLLHDHPDIRSLARWTTRPACIADFNCSGTPPDPDDVLDFIGAWLALDPRADVNLSGALSVQDIFDFLAAYFAGCV